MEVANPGLKICVEIFPTDVRHMPLGLHFGGVGVSSLTVRV